MKTGSCVTGPGGRAGRFCLWGLLIGGLTAAGRAAPPLDPLPAPLFSFDIASQAVVDDTVDADEILALDFPNLQAMFAGWAFGLGLAMDDLDALSVAGTDVAIDAPFALLFSVDTETVGVADADPTLVSLGVPYNVRDQAQRGQAAGDEFMSTRLFTRSGSRGTIAAVEPVNSVLVRNNFDEGGTDFIASPASSADDVIEDEPQDSVDAIATPTAENDPIYFSAGADSPSLIALSGPVPPSGANIFVFMPGEAPLRTKGTHGRPRRDRLIGNPPPPPCWFFCDQQAQQAYANCMQQGGSPEICDAVAQDVRRTCMESQCDPPCRVTCKHQADQVFMDCMDGGGTVQECAEAARTALWECLQTECAIMPPPTPWLYAPFPALGLQPADDIDALIVFDTNADRAFNGFDQVLFSLAPGSPSLSTIPGASASGAAADVFIVTAGRHLPVVFASAADLGLGHPSDNIDALDYTLCDDAVGCATAHGIRASDPIPTLSEWGAAALTLLLLVAGTTILSRRRLAS